MFTATAPLTHESESGQIVTLASSVVTGEPSTFSLSGFGEPLSFVNGRWVPSSQVRGWARAWDSARVAGKSPMRLRAWSASDVRVSKMPAKMRRQMLRDSKIKMLAARFDR